MSSRDPSQFLRLADWHADLVAQADRLRGMLGPDPLVGVYLDLERIRGRLELGVDHTIVALMGGTGSGKSSLFNALSAMTFAQVGVLRPTTSRPTAFIWGGRADALMRWLAIPEGHWMVRESPLDAQRQQALRGLILLDMPDYDSVVDEHRAHVERVAPMVDLLVWVLDPQKYADADTHDGFLTHLAGFESNVVVVVNQMDRVPPDQREGLLADVRVLLRHDGLESVEVIATAAPTGEGVDELRDRLVAATALQPTVARRAESELSLVAARLAQVVGAIDTGAEDAAVAQAVAACAATALAMAGVDAYAATAASGVGIATPVALDEDAGVAMRASWLEALAPALPGGWLDAVGRVIAAPGDLATAVSTAVLAVPGPRRPGAVARAVNGTRAQRRAAQDYLARVSDAVGAVVDQALGQPTRRVLRLRRETEAAVSSYRPDV